MGINDYTVTISHTDGRRVGQLHFRKEEGGAEESPERILER
jgi:hypothetical protein